VAGDARRAALDMAMAAPPAVAVADRSPHRHQPNATSVELKQLDAESKQLDAESKQLDAESKQLNNPDDDDDADNATSPARYGLFSREFARRHARHLLGASAPWFLLGAALYSQTLLQRDIFSGMGWLPRAPAMSALEEVYKLGRAQLLLALCSTLPGIWLTIALVDVVGRVKLQLLGFFVMTAFLFGLAAPYNTLRATHASLALYAFAFFFANFGPNLTTTIIAAELFPARFRTTCFGIAAAAGKAGAIVGTFGFLYASQSNVPGQQDPGYPNGIGLRSSLLILAAVNTLGFFFTFLVPETKQRSLEDISGEITDLHNPRDAVAGAGP
jgi:PHS family inorganic phosphate transporter-like MFS transporter